MKSVLQTLLAVFMITSNANASTAEGFLGVVNKADGTSSIINVRTGETRTTTVGQLPHEMAVAAGLAYVSNYGSAHVRSSDVRNMPGNTLSVFKVDGSAPVTELQMGPSRCAPHGVVASKDGKHLYVTCEGRQEIAVIETTTGTLSHTLPTNQAGSHMLVISSDETRAYVTNFWLGTVSVIDLVQRKLLKQVFVGRGCEGIGLSEDNRTVYVTRVEDAEIVKVDTDSLKVIHRVKLSGKSSPIRVTVVPGDPKQILVIDSIAGTLRLMNSEDLSVNKEIKVGQQPLGLAASSTHAFVANMKDNSVTVINLQSAQIEAEYPTGNSPDGITYFR